MFLSLLVVYHVVYIRRSINNMYIASCKSLLKVARDERGLLKTESLESILDFPVACLLGDAFQETRVHRHTLFPKDDPINLSWKLQVVVCTALSFTLGHARSPPCTGGVWRRPRMIRRRSKGLGEKAWTS
mmetsp:Transcript_130144/g.193697  ORF Transcript_130144/g.193697 Transcript_130144/m.193697 type:complete len:130 (+) Transcript_130144:2-391(+)